MDESAAGRIDRLVREGRMPREAVDTAEQLWRERLRGGVELPNGERVTITLGDVHHVIIDVRIWRHPERIERALAEATEIRLADDQFRHVLSRWDEGAQEVLGHAVLRPDGGLQALHLVDERRIRREQRRGVLLWRRSAPP